MGYSMYAPAAPCVMKRSGGAMPWTRGHCTEVSTTITSSCSITIGTVYRNTLYQYSHNKVQGDKKSKCNQCTMQMFYERMDEQQKDYKNLILMIWFPLPWGANQGSGGGPLCVLGVWTIHKKRKTLWPSGNETWLGSHKHTTSFLWLTDLYSSNSALRNSTSPRRLLVTARP